MSSRIAVISDIHANGPALEAVLRRIRTMRISDIICLGDIVGYGPHPGECIDLVMQHCRQSVQGNHDLAACDPTAAANFNGTARHAIFWTREALKPRHLEMLRLLPQIGFVDNDAMFLHDCPVQAPSDYIYDASMAALAFRGVDLRICLVGHTHVPIVFEAPTSRVEDSIRPQQVATYPMRMAQAIRLRSGRRYICNPGSVGQPRDNDPRACFGVLDLDRFTFGIERVEYDIATVQRDSQRAGLPPFLATRLAIGA